MTVPLMHTFICARLEIIVNIDRLLSVIRFRNLDVYHSYTVNFNGAHITVDGYTPVYFLLIVDNIEEISDNFE